MRSVAILLVCCFALCIDGTTSYSAALPPPRLVVPTPLQWSVSRPQQTTPASDLVEPLHNMKSVLRRAKSRLQTLVRKKTDPAKKQKEPEEMWQVLFHDTKYLPGHVARILAKVFPISRKAAYEICLRAREEGMVPLTVCNKKQAEKYCGAILRQGLTATIEPLDFT
ncbi:hypothetical protein QTG54_014841 [Skeletonema marinoi]|uniref:Adaptor protein ClpS core domain-containing protein n=1 Tax=Skeletonema marinoi TaxID=267567 RepID=A0AAD8XUX4_9STRA|nr:hypothetical protein QTG54_014841 [Skeletonema marinoi]